MLTSLLAALVSVALGGHYSRLWSLPVRPDVRQLECHPFLPKNLLVDTPSSADDPRFLGASQNLDYLVAAVTARKPIDSLSVAVVNAGGAIYEKNFGVVKGNESRSEATTSESVYRIASVAKVFPVYEALLLEQKGALSWDDLVQKYIPDFTYRLDGFNSSSAFTAPDPSTSPITVRHLATHLSGMGRDWPPGTVSEFPHSLQGAGPPPTNGRPFPEHEDVLDATRQRRLTSPPGKYPAYSNTATALLGQVVVIANRMWKEAKEGSAWGEPETFEALVERDIFKLLGMKGSSFKVKPGTEKTIVVPSLAPEVIDQDFLDAMNPAAGQFSSLSDMITFTQTLLAPGPLAEHQLDQWYRAAFVFEEDDTTEVGMMWEIIKKADSRGRKRRIFWKLGAMAGHHAALAIHPGTGYGVIVLLTGHYPDAAKIAYDIFGVVQPAIDYLAAARAAELYAGTWFSAPSNTSGTDMASFVSVSVEGGTLWLQKYVLQGVDVLRLFGAPAGGKVALRFSGRRDEFRVDTGIPGYNGMEHMACYPYWNGQDLWGVRNEAAVNVVVFEEVEGKRRLRVPAVDEVMYRK